MRLSRNITRKFKFYFFVIVTMAALGFAINYFSVSRSEKKVSKKQLKGMFKGITGRDATKEEKGDYWEGQTGDRNPSKNKKDEHWDKAD